MREKIYSYLGFAKKSRNLIAGYNTCIMAANKNKVKLLILTGDLAENTVKKMKALSEKQKIPLLYLKDSEEEFERLGLKGKGVFAILDSNFAKVISEEIKKITE